MDSLLRTTSGGGGMGVPRVQGSSPEGVGKEARGHEEVGYGA